MLFYTFIPHSFKKSIVSLYEGTAALAPTFVHLSAETALEKIALFLSLKSLCWWEKLIFSKTKMMFKKHRKIF